MTVRTAKLLVLTAISSFLPSEPLAAQCSGVIGAVNPNDLGHFDEIRLVPSGFTSAQATGALGPARSLWNSTACNPYDTIRGFGFAPFVMAISPVEQIAWTVELRGSSAPSPDSRCGGTDFNTQTITIYTTNASAQTCFTTNEQLKDLIAHELGHTLGLGDSGCGVMQTSVSPGHDWPAPASGECFLARQIFTTDFEDECDHMDNPPACENCDYGECHSPLVLDLDGNGFAFGEPTELVPFDLDADGVLDLVSWIAPGEADGFLALDRDGNGTIDDGSELFGDATSLTSGEIAGNGFTALHELDSIELGGNLDGWVDRSDWGFHGLLVWQDTNRNGFSEPTELRSLRRLGIEALRVAPIVDSQTDAWGNEALFWSEGLRRTRRRVERFGVVDVYFIRWD